MQRAADPRSTAAEPAAKETLASSIYDQLSRDILIPSRCPPSTKLNIRALCERFDVGLQPGARRP